MSDFFSNDLLKEKIVLSRRERKKLNQRYAIIRAAQFLIEENGYDETSINAIADAADISYQTFFNYFPTKDDMLLAIDAIELEDLQEVASLRLREGDSIANVLKNVFFEWVDDCVKYRTVDARMRAVVMRHMTEPGLGTVTMFLSRLIEQGIAQGEFSKDADADGAAMMLSGLRSEIAFTCRKDFAEEAYERVIERILI